MSLKSRIEGFNALSRRFSARRPSPLLLAHKIEEADFEKLRIAAAIYLSKCLTDGKIYLNEKKLIKAILKQRHQIPNITPNGMVVPKQHTILEYNALVQAFAQVINTLNINDFIVSWHIPLNLRIKDEEASSENLKRHHPTEHIHSDSWAGESSESVTTIIPLFGDVKRHHVIYYNPPADFQESWLKPLPSYIAGAPIAKKYKPIRFIPQKGQLIISDFASLHASHREKKSGLRISIDTTFVLKRKTKGSKKENIHAWRKNERASHELLSNIGRTHVFSFPDTVDQKVDSRGGFKHPTHLKIVEIL